MFASSVSTGVPRPISIEDWTPSRLSQEVLAAARLRDEDMEELKASVKELAKSSAEMARQLAGLNGQFASLAIVHDLERRVGAIDVVVAVVPRLQEIVERLDRSQQRTEGAVRTLMWVVGLGVPVFTLITNASVTIWLKGH